TYRDFVPCARAFSCIIHRMRDVFIVPGVPATRTVLPFGMPPPRTRSRPSTYVWRIGTSSSMSCEPRNPRYKAVASPLSKEIFFRASWRRDGQGKWDPEGAIGTTVPRIALGADGQARRPGSPRTIGEATTRPRRARGDASRRRPQGPRWPRCRGANAPTRRGLDG